MKVYSWKYKEMGTLQKLMKHKTNQTKMVFSISIMYVTNIDSDINEEELKLDITKFNELNVTMEEE